MSTDKPLIVRPVASVDAFADESALNHTWRVAKLFANSKLVPAHLQGKPEDCAIAFAMARRLNEDPLVVLQSIYIVSGTPGWKTTYMIARANRSGLLKGRINWRVEGKGNDLRVTAFATLAEGDPIEISADMAMAQAEEWTKNKKYKSMPEVMLRYRSAAMLIRMYLPEVMLGLPTVEELETDPVSAPPAREVVNAPKGKAALGLPSAAPDFDHPEPVEDAEVKVGTNAPDDLHELRQALTERHPNGPDLLAELEEQAGADGFALAKLIADELEALPEGE